MNSVGTGWSQVQTSPLYFYCYISTRRIANVEELNANNEMEIRIRPVVDTGGGNWENLGSNYFYTTEA